MSSSRDERIEVVKMGAHIGAEIRGVNLSETQGDVILDAIHTALMDHGVIIFRNQTITSEAQIAFGRQFGELTIHPFSPNLPETPELIILDNHEKNPPRLTDQWHSDETFRKEPPMGTILRSAIIPPVGGDTVFASMVAAFEGLSERVQEFIMDLKAIHDFKPFRTLFTDSEDDIKKRRRMEDMFPNPLHPVVRIHPVTGQKTLFVNPQFTTMIKDLKDRESRAVLDMLFHQAEIPDYQFRVKWEPEMLVFWDNRAVQHYAVHDYYPHRRRMERITLKGDRPYGPSEKDRQAFTSKQNQAVEEHEGGNLSRPFEREDD